MPLWRNDAGNNGLHDSVEAAFLGLGGLVAPGYRYEPKTTDFTTAINSAASQLSNLLTTGLSASQLGVYLAAFDEVVDVFHIAQGSPLLSSTRWYGSDGVALSAVLPADVAAAGFAATVDYPNPIFGLDDSLKSSWQPISDAIEARTGIKPDAFALSAYDSLFVIHQALQDAGGLKDFTAFKAAFVNEANTYVGVTGSTALDSAGDRLDADFDFWAVRLENGSYTWLRVATYNNGALSFF